MMRGRVARALKAPYLDRCSASRCSTCLWKTKQQLLKNWHRRRGFMSSDQPLPLPYLSPSSSLSTWTRVTKSRSRVDLLWLSCLVPAESLRPRIGHQRWPCLVSNHTTTTSIWLLVTAMLSSHTIVTTMNRLSMIALLGPISTIGLRPWVSCQRLLCLVLQWLMTNDPEARLEKSLSMTYRG